MTEPEPETPEAQPKTKWERLRAVWRKRRIGRWLAVSLLTMVLALALIYWDVRRTGAPIYTDVLKVEPKPVAIVFGAGYGRFGPSAILYDRVATAADLYKAGKVQKLLMTGDNGKSNYNEPEMMRQTARKLGVPDKDIVLDFAGFRTYDSLYRARDIFCVRQAILVTQAYHLPRALFTARRLGMEVEGVSADRRDYGTLLGYHLREIAATESAWFEASLFHPRPKFLGRQEPIFQ